MILLCRWIVCILLCESCMALGIITMLKNQLFFFVVDKPMSFAHLLIFFLMSSGT